MENPANEHHIRANITSLRETSAWKEAATAGIDMSLIEHTLGLTVWERLIAHQRALAQVRMFQNAKLKPNG